jgi:hypothetical protein
VGTWPSSSTPTTTTDTLMRLMRLTSHATRRTSSM